MGLVAWQNRSCRLKADSQDSGTLGTSPPRAERTVLSRGSLPQTLTSSPKTVPTPFGRVGVTAATKPMTKRVISYIQSVIMASCGNVMRRVITVACLESWSIDRLQDPVGHRITSEAPKKLLSMQERARGRDYFFTAERDSTAPRKLLNPSDNTLSDNTPSVSARHLLLWSDNPVAPPD